MPVIYTAEVQSTGDGRKGTVRSGDGVLDLTLTPPKEVGGSGAGSNPEQLFAAGYAACFHSALRLAAKEKDVTLVDDVVSVEVDLVKGDDGFRIAARVLATLPGLSQADADALVAAAHGRCPYSRALRDGADVVVSARG